MGGVVRSGLVLGAMFLALAAPARGDERSRATLSGQITVAWHGDPARGCEGAGLCGYSGTVTWKPGTRAELALQPRFPAYLFPNEDTTVIARTQREGGGACVDAMTLSFVRIEARTWSPRTLRFADDISSGRCAGPSPADLATALPRATFDPVALRRAGGRLRWPSGPFAAGAWSGQVTSTLAARLAPLRRQRVPAASGRPRVPERLRGRTLYSVSREYEYRATRVAGAIDTGFHGTSGATCVLLDSCGTTGAAKLTATGAELDLFGEGTSLEPHPHLAIDVEGQLGGTRTTQTLRRADTPDCSDGRDPGDIPLGGAAHGSRVRITIGAADTEAPDAVRTRCPGPSQQDVFGGATIARGSIARSALGARHLVVVLRARGSFASPGYAGTRSGTVTLDLERVAAHVRHSRRKL